MIGNKDPNRVTFLLEDQNKDSRINYMHVLYHTKLNSTAYTSTMYNNESKRPHNWR